MDLNYSPTFDSRIHSYTTANLQKGIYYFTVKMEYNFYNTEYSNNEIYATVNSEQDVNAGKWEKYLPKNSAFTPIQEDRYEEPVTIVLDDKNTSRKINIKHSHNGDYVFKITKN